MKSHFAKAKIVALRQKSTFGALRHKDGTYAGNICVIEKSENEVVVGVSLLSNSDQYVRKLGNMIAFGRAASVALGQDREGTQRWTKVFGSKEDAWTAVDALKARIATSRKKIHPSRPLAVPVPVTV